MKFFAPDAVSGIYLARGPVPVKRPARGKAYLTLDAPTQGDLMHLAVAGFVAAPLEKEPAK